MTSKLRADPAKTAASYIYTPLELVHSGHLTSSTIRLTTNMSKPTFYAYEGIGKDYQQKYWYSQAVRVGDTIECSGQGMRGYLFLEFKLTIYWAGGWDPQTGECKTDIDDQIDQAFANVELALKDAGGRGWQQVFRVRSYHVPLDDKALEGMVRNFKKWLPDHQPIWTCVGVVNLALPGMKVEIEVVASDAK